MSKLQAQIDADWTKIQSEINASAERHYWVIRLQRGAHVPTRQLISIAQQAIQNFHDAGINENPPTDVGRFVAEASQWMERVRGKLWAVMREEEGDGR